MAAYNIFYYIFFTCEGYCKFSYFFIISHSLARAITLTTKILFFPSNNINLSMMALFYIQIMVNLIKWCLTRGQRGVIDYSYKVHVLQSFINLSFLNLLHPATYAFQPFSLCPSYSLLGILRRQKSILSRKHKIAMAGLTLHDGSVNPRETVRNVNSITRKIFQTAQPSQARGIIVTSLQSKHLGTAAR